MIHVPGCGKFVVNESYRGVNGGSSVGGAGSLLNQNDRNEIIKGKQ